jgi:TIR domain
MGDTSKKWDVFISHASEDKDAFVRPLATALQTLEVSVWYDEFSLRLGYSLARSIDKGLAESRFGIVVISPDFIRKRWTEYELRGLVQREIYEEDRFILPIWHGVTKEQVMQFSPSLADKVALDTAKLDAQKISIQILREIRPDIYRNYPRSELEWLASGDAVKDLQQEIEQTRRELESAQEELAEYRCPYCNSPLSSRIHAPADEEEKDWDIREEFQCGHKQFGGLTERPCPTDPRFPKFEDYDLHFRHYPEESEAKWRCLAVGKTKFARQVHLSPGSGKTKEEAENRVREQYDRYAIRASAFVQQRT